MKARTTGNPLIIVFLFFKKIFFSLFIIFFVAILFRIRIKFFLVMCIWYKNEFIQHSFVIQCYRNGVMDLNMRKNISSFFLDKATEKMKWNLISSRPFFIHQKSNLRKKTSLCDWHEYDDDDMKSDDNIVIDLLFTTSFVLVWKKKIKWTQNHWIYGCVIFNCGFFLSAFVNDDDRCQYSSQYNLVEKCTIQNHRQRQSLVPHQLDNQIIMVM